MLFRSLNADGSFTYTPNDGYFGTDSFTYRASDGIADSEAATVSIVVRGVAKPVIELITDSGVDAQDRITRSPTLDFSDMADGVTRQYIINGGTPTGTFTTPEVDGFYTVQIVDSDVHGNSASSSIDFTLDRSGPTVAITADKPALKAGESATLTFAFSEIPHGFTLADVTVANGTLGELVATADPKVFTAVFTPAQNVTNPEQAVVVAAASYTDVAGNQGAAGDTALAIDTAAPSVTVTSSQSSVAFNQTATLTFTFDEIPAGFALNDISVSHGSIGALTATGDPKVFTALFTPPVNQAATAVTVVVGSQSYNDTAGNAGAGASATLNVDTSVKLALGAAPTVIVMNEDTPTFINKSDFALSVKNSADTNLSVPDSSIWIVLDSMPGVGTLRLRDANGNFSAVAVGARISLDQIGNLQFTPKQDEYAIRYDRFSYHAEYGEQGRMTASATSEMWFGVRNVNDAPVGGTILPVTLKQGQSVSIDLKSVFTDVDPDDRGRLTYAVSAASGVTATIHGSTLTVTNVAGAANPVSLAITATDRSGATGTTSLTLSLAGPDNLPNIDPTLIAPTSVSIAESARAGDIVFTVTAEDTLADNGDGINEPLSYTLTGADASRFSIDSQGRVTLVKALNFEKPSDLGGVAVGDNVYAFTVNVSDGRGGVVSRNVSVDVTNVIEGAQPGMGDGNIEIGVEAGGSNQVDLSKIYFNNEGSSPIAFQIGLNGVFGNPVTDPVTGVTATLSGSVLKITAPANFSGFFDLTVRTTANQIGTDYTAHISLDKDTDGVDDFTELFVGDANNDGITDDLQSDVASFPAVSTDPADPNSYMSLAATRDTSPAISDAVNEVNVALHAALMNLFGNSAEEQALLATISSALKIENVGVGSVSRELGEKLLGDIGTAEQLANMALQSLEAPLGILQFTLKPEIIETTQQLIALRDANQQAYDAYMEFKASYEADLMANFATRQQMVKVILPAGTLINSYLKPVFQTDTSGQFVLDGTGNKIVLRYEDFTLQTITVDGKQLQTGAKYFNASGVEIQNIKALNSEQLAAARVAYVELYFVDNQRGDDDRTLGAIVDPGVFALIHATAAPAPVPAPVDPANPIPAPVLAPVVIRDGVPPVMFSVSISLPAVPDRQPVPAFDSLLRPTEIAFSTQSGLDSLGAGSWERFSFSDWGRSQDNVDTSYTMDIGWKGMVLPAHEANLTVFRGVGDQYSERGASGSFTIPADAFVHTKSDAWIQLVAELADGSPLPKWLQFDGRTGLFKFTPPEGFNGELKIKLTAHDNAGREAKTMFRFQVGDQEAKIVGRPSFSDQLKGAVKGGNKELSDTVNKPQIKGSPKPAKPA